VFLFNVLFIQLVESRANTKLGLLLLPHSGSLLFYARDIVCYSDMAGWVSVRHTPVLYQNG